MNLSRKELKADARLAMREHTPSVLLVALVFLIIMRVLNLLSVKLQFPGYSYAEIFRTFYDYDLLEEMLARSYRLGILSRAIHFALNMMSAAVDAGFVLFCLRVVRRVEAGFGDLFDGFAFLLKILWLNILEGLVIALWTLLLIVPGIIAAYRYSFALFILLDDPDKRVVDCLRESRETTLGYKGALFVLDLSMIGWGLLSLIPFVNIFTLPYYTAIRANYYRAITGRHAEPARNSPDDYDAGWGA